MPTTCVIELESTNQSQIIFSGQVLRGTVHLTLTNEKTIRGVLITFTGKAYCCWKKTYGKSTRVFKAEENHLNQQAYLIGSNNGKEAFLNKHKTILFFFKHFFQLIEAFLLIFFSTR